MAKPFSIQAPEEIAKTYAGNKQRIMEAAQMGIVDPTAAILAGMFIDRMRGAQAQEGANPPTVAQEVMGGAPPAPPAPSPAAGGLGVIPQGAPPMAPETTMPPQAPMEAPIGMAEGGLVGLPVPDTMFDEPTNGGYDDGYAGGGLVAFSNGGPTWASAPVSSGYGVKRATGTHKGIDFAIPGGTPVNPLAGGTVEVADTDNINGNYIVVRHPNGATTSYSHLSKLNVARGQQVGAGDVIGLSGNTGRSRGKNGGYHLHFGARDAEGNRIDPNAVLKDVSALSAGRQAGATGGLGSTAPAAPSASAESLTAAFQPAVERGFNFYDTNMPKPKREARDKLLEYIGAEGSPEAIKKQEKQDKWSALAEFGFRMASSNSPYFLQAVGEAATATLPGTKDAKKEREARKLRALQAFADAEGIDNEEAKQRVRFGLDFANTELGLKDKDIGRQFEERMTRLREAGDTERTRMQVDARIAAADARTEAALAAAADKIYDTGTQKIIYGTDKKGKPLEREVPSRVNRRTGDVELYSNEVGGYLTPQYATAVAQSPDSIRALQSWAQARKARIDVVNGRIMATYGNGSQKPVYPTWFTKGYQDWLPKK